MSITNIIYRSIDLQGSVYVIMSFVFKASDSYSRRAYENV